MQSHERRSIGLRYVALLVVVATLAYLVRGLFTPGVHSPIADPDDFRAFYCAGRATIERADPYTTEPIRGCERAAARAFAFDFPARLVVPAPLPPYALAFFAPLGALPFPLASALWFLCSLLALGVSIVLTVRASGISPVVVALAFVCAGGVSINEGQLAPLITAALCVAAAGLASRSASVAGTGLGLAMIEPHVAVTALVGAWGERASRRTILVALAVLASLDVAAGGPARTIEYFARVLPLHARSEIAFYAQQFSLTTTAWSFGVPAGVALLLGTLDYVAMFALGVAVALRLNLRFRDRTFLVFVPPAFVLLGGSFIHLFQMEIALPLAFLCYAKMPRRRVLLACAILGLAIPTQFFVLASPLRAVFYTPDPHVARAALPNEARALAEVTERDANPFGPLPDLRHALVATVPKLPTWLALAALVAACLFEAFSSGATTSQERVPERFRGRAEMRSRSPSKSG